VQFRIDYVNNGTVPLTNISLIDTLPARMVLVAGQLSQFVQTLAV